MAKQTSKTMRQQTTPLFIGRLKDAGLFRGVQQNPATLKTHSPKISWQGQEPRAPLVREFATQFTEWLDKTTLEQKTKATTRTVAV